MTPLPDFCDLMCVHAEMPTHTALDGSGSCRTFIAIYCKKRKGLVAKNIPCADKKFKGKPAKTRT